MSDEVLRRWKAFRLAEPVYRLTIRGAPKAGVDQERFDLIQLALNGIDFVVSQQASIEGSVSPGRVIDHLTQIAVRMSPGDPRQDARKAAQMVFEALLNDGHRHVVRWRKLAGHDGDWVDSLEWSFRLLRLADGEEGTVVTATDEAIVLYLDVLDTDLADREMAQKLITKKQMERGEFEKALRSAVDARRSAEGYATQLRERLDDTRRDLRSVDWSVDMPARLRAALEHVTEQISQDRLLLGLAEQGVMSDDPTASESCRRIIDEVQRGQDVHTRLERRIQTAIPVFLEAQVSQRFAANAMAIAINLVNDVLRPYLASPAATATEVADLWVAPVAGPVVPAMWTVDSVVSVLWAPIRIWERGESIADDPGELVDRNDDSVPADVIAAAVDVLTAATVAALPMSDLIARARTVAATTSQPGQLVDVVWAACLCAYVADNEFSASRLLQEELPADPTFADLLTRLSATDAGAVLDDPDFHGADLMIGPADTSSAQPDAVSLQNALAHV